MEPSKFNKLVEEFIDQEELILNLKRQDYASSDDRIENFKTVAKFLDVKASDVALTYLMKHIQSLAVAVQSKSYDWCWQNNSGHEGLKQRIADARNYLLLLAACIEEESNVTLRDIYGPIDNIEFGAHQNEKE